MLRLRKHLLMSLLCFLVVVPTILAQEITPEDQINLVAPSTSGETGLFTGVLADTLKQGDWSFGIYYNNYDYLAAPPTAAMIVPSRRSFREMDIEDTRISASVGYGLTDRWEISAQIPYVMLENNAGDQSGFVNGYPYIGKFDENGIGNAHIATKFGFFNPETSLNRFAVSAFVDLPTGDDDGGIASGNTDLGFGLHFNRGVFSVSGQYKIAGDRNADATPFRTEFELPDEIRLDAGLNLPLSFWSTTNWINEVNIVLPTGGFREPDDIIYLVSGIRHWFGTSGWGMSAGVRTNIAMWNSDNNSCPIGGLFGLHYAPMHLASMRMPPKAPDLPEPPPTPAPVPTEPEPVAAPKGPTDLRTDEINFESGSARLTNIAKAILDDVALRMKQESSATAMVLGYTDDRESTGPNADLDRRRAEAVRDYLVSRHNIDPSRITVEGRDGREPIGDNTTAEGRLRNRRVVIKLQIP